MRPIFNSLLGLWNLKNLVGGGFAAIGAAALIGIAAAALSPVIVIAAGMAGGITAALALTNLVAGIASDKPINIPTGPYQLAGLMMDHAFDPNLPMEEVGPSQHAGNWADILALGGCKKCGQWVYGKG